MRTADVERRREGGTEATDLLTGQLEGANPLSELNIPDRVGMQQGDSERRGHSPSGAPWECSCWLFDISLVSMELLLLVMIQEMTTYEAAASEWFQSKRVTDITVKDGKI